jgi:predicted PurR-regulated permease PerM
VTGIIPLVLSILISYALAPFVSRLESLHIARPFAVPLFASLLFWGWIWGVWGLLLAVPIMAAKAVCERRRAYFKTS